MGARLILDTGVLVRAERAGSGLAAVVGPDDDVTIAAVTLAELLAGVELSDAGHRAARASFADRVAAVLPVEVYDARVARVHAGLLAHTRRTGRQRGAHDLLIAATAVATGRTLVTTDAAARFAPLPGVAVIPV